MRIKKVFDFAIESNWPYVWSVTEMRGFQFFIWPTWRITHFFIYRLFEETACFFCPHLWIVTFVYQRSCNKMYHWHFITRFRFNWLWLHSFISLFEARFARPLRIHGSLTGIPKVFWWNLNYNPSVHSLTNLKKITMQSRHRAKR